MLRDASIFLIMILIIMVLGIGFYANYQQQAQLRIQIERMNQAWMDSNQSVIQSLNRRDAVAKEAYNERRIIYNVKDSCLDSNVPDTVARVLDVQPLTRQQQYNSNQSGTN